MTGRTATDGTPRGAGTVGIDESLEPETGTTAADTLACDVERTALRATTPRPTPLGTKEIVDEEKKMDRKDGNGIRADEKLRKMRP